MAATIDFLRLFGGFGLFLMGMLVGFALAFLMMEW